MMVTLEVVRIVEVDTEGMTEDVNTVTVSMMVAVCAVTVSVTVLAAVTVTMAVKKLVTGRVVG
jgi:hypothetical protein